VRASRAASRLAAQVLGFCGYDFGARNLAGGLKAGRGFVKPKPLSPAEVARIDAQEGQAPIVPEAEYGVPEGAAQAARAALALEAAGGEGAEAEASDEAAVAAPAPVRPRPVRVEVELSYRVGERVRVLKGPFKNLEGPVLAIEATADDGEEAAAPDNSSSVRVTVELSLMGQPTVVDLDARALVSVLQ
jgi:transcription antitermination factor NusG